jgi:hypothetical protein
MVQGVGPEFKTPVMPKKRKKERKRRKKDRKKERLQGTNGI